MNIDWGAGPAFKSEKEWNDWQQKATKICVSHHYACKCREEIFVRMLATLEDIAEADHGEGFPQWAQERAMAMVKMARGESCD